MPTVRYQIRNEYGLADPELYRAADKDDPEALLEGVAMAGLVGVLRQLGDLAEFAAEIFHDLHEEVTSTAARGHGLLMRVQQLEAEFPSIEKAFLVQTNHSQFAYNDGIDWYANLRMDQNLVTQGDMPRFVLDSYEECRGPPRLFMLDKFDVAGSGACLTRYSDPSFFKVEFSSSCMMEEEMQWQNKPRKIRKKASRWKNGETAATFMSPFINSNLQTENSEQVSAKVPARRVKLKSRNLLDSDITNRKSYMEHLLEVHSPGQVWPENSINHLPEIVKSIDYSGLTPEAREIVIDTIIDSPIVRATYPSESPTRKEVAYFPTNELDNHKIKRVEKSESTPEKRIMIVPDKTESFGGYVSDKPEKRSYSLMEVGQQKPLNDVDFTTETGFDCDMSGYMSVEAEKSHVAPMENAPDKYLVSFESNTEDEYGDHRSDGISSDLENYMDALNTMDSEVETDHESRAKSEKGFSNMETHRIDSGICEQQDLPTQPSEPDSVGELTTSREWNGMLEHFPDSFISGDFAETKQPVEDVNGFSVPDNDDNFVQESYGEMLDELQGSDEVRACESSVDLLPNGICNAKESDATSIKSIVGEGSFGSPVMDFTSSHVDILPKEGDEAWLVTSLHDVNTGYAEGTHVVSEQLDCKMEGLPNFTDDPDNISGELIPLIEMGDLSVEGEYVLQGIDPAECVQEQISEEGTIDMSDHLSEAKDRSDLEEIPAEHLGESVFDLSANPEEKVVSVKVIETCLDGSVSPNSPESSPEISSNDVQNSHEVVRYLDGELPHTDDIGFTEPPMKSRAFCDDLLLLSDTPGFSSTEDVEPLFFKDMKDIQWKTIPEEVPSRLAEDPVVLNVELGALEDPREHDNKTFTLENMLHSDPALSLEDNQLTVQVDVLPIGMRNIGVEDACTEYTEERKSLLPNTVPLELDHFSDVEDPQESHEANSEEASTMSSRKETVLDDMQLQLNNSVEAAGKRNILMPNEKSPELENSSMKAEPQGSRDDSMEHFLLGTANAIFADDMQLQNERLGLMVNSNTEDPKEPHNATLMEHFPVYSASEILPNDMQLLHECGHMVTSDESDPIECPIVDASEHFSQDSNHGNFSDDLQFQNNEHGHLLDTLGLPNGSAASDLHKESVLLEKHTECTAYDDSSDEYVIVEADDNNRSIYSVHSGKSSGFDLRLQENYLHHDAFLDKHDMEVKESSYVNNLILLPSQNESQPTWTTAGLCSTLPVLCSSDPADAKLLDNLSCTIPLKPDTDEENLVCSLENGVSIPNEGNSPSSHVIEDGSEPLVAPSHQDSSRLESMHTQFQITCINDINIAQSISKDNVDQPSKREPHVIVSNGEIDESDTTLLKVDVHVKVEDEASVASRCSSEFLVASLKSSFSAAELAPIAGSTKEISKSGMQEASIASSTQIISEIGLQEATMARSSQDLSEASLQESETILQETDIASSSHATAENVPQETAESWLGEPTSSSQSQDAVETPQLPPLPPMEWRLGKLRFGSLASSVDFIQPPTMVNPSMKLISGDAKLPQGPQTTMDEMVQPETSFASLAQVGNEKFHHGSLTLEEETTESSRLSKLPLILDESRHHKSLILETEVTNPSNSFLSVSHQEDLKCSNGRGALSPELEGETTQYPQMSEGESQHRRPQLGHLLPSLELERSQYEALSVANTIPPPKPFFIEPSTEEWKHEYGYEVFGGENVQHLNFSDPVVARGPNMPPYGFLYSVGQNPSTIYDFTISTIDGDKPKWTYRSIRDRPRDPLIEAVAAHDKSTLRKVSELDRPLARPQADERDSLLEQIRNKAFNLKPANGPKPNIKGVPPTNLKVAAILEKANAIRQACAGSDEDEDGDNWSDS